LAVPEPKLSEEPRRGGAETGSHQAVLTNHPTLNGDADLATVPNDIPGHATKVPS